MTQPPTEPHDEEIGPLDGTFDPIESLSQLWTSWYDPGTGRIGRCSNLVEALVALLGDQEIGRLGRRSDPLVERTLCRCRRCHLLYVSVESIMPWMHWSTLGIGVGPAFVRASQHPTMHHSPRRQPARDPRPPDECWAMWLDAKQQGRVCTCDGRESVTVFDDEADELFGHLVRLAEQLDEAEAR